MNGLQPTSASAWLDDYEVVELPSGKRVGMRQVDAISLMTQDGKIPQYLRANLAGKKEKATAQYEATAEDKLETLSLAEKVIRAGLVEPRLVETAAEEAEGKGIQMIRIAFMDKMALLTWAMGGKVAVDAAQRFLEPAQTDLQLVAE